MHGIDKKEKMLFSFRPLVKRLAVLFFFLLGPFTSVFPAPVALGTISSNISESAINLAAIISAGGLVAGVGFLFAAFFKFDKHKKNPQQVPIGQPMTLLIIAATLCSFPVAVPLIQNSIFGTSAERGQIDGNEGIQSIVAGGS